jgi:hypothetical protein
MVAHHHARLVTRDDVARYDVLHPNELCGWISMAEACSQQVTEGVWFVAMAVANIHDQPKPTYLFDRARKQCKRFPDIPSTDCGGGTW